MAHFKSSYRVVLVPKLRLGTHFREAPLRNTGHNPSGHRLKESFDYMRPKQRLGTMRGGNPIQTFKTGQFFADGPADTNAWSSLVAWSLGRLIAGMIDSP